MLISHLPYKIAQFGAHIFSESLVGAVAWARVQKVDAQAVFCDIGMPLLGFMRPPKKRLRVGEWYLVQICKDSYANKGARLSLDICLRAPYLWFMPNGVGVQVSRHFTGDSSVLVNLEGGWIVRRHANQSENLAKNAQALIDLWADICNAPRQVGVVWQMPFVAQALLAWLDDGNQSVWHCTDMADIDTLRQYLAQFAPSMAIQTQYAPAQLLPILQKAYARLGVQSLPSGGNFCIQLTEAMAVVDINAGAKSGVCANVETARQIMDFLIGMRVGGLVAIDFIDGDLTLPLSILQKSLRRYGVSAPKLQANHGVVVLSLPRKSASILHDRHHMDKIDITMQLCAYFDYCHAQHKYQRKLTVALPTDVFAEQSQDFVQKVSAYLGVSIDWQFMPACVIKPC